ncbi:ATP synthase F1 subunit delta [Marixanthomonas spongiae]|uniref:ATP synthase subunit delta n=1 Tax=Marixanthomonas spongiae TaxID=2174845 RepID=A0A2U0I1X6_9FLAO|nr:ATP synthase F1 subunit delta [Marixanthomonas spongiae]PVW15109.1 ATP synthase F1 subunit delta [Marixanthomonas spongiae]
MSRAAIRYAKAALQLAGENSTENVLFGDMQSIQETLEESKELRNMLSSPIIKAEDKKQVLLKVFSGQDDVTKNLIALLVANQRTALLGNVAKSYIELYNKEQGLQVAKVTTAVPLSPELEKKVLEKVKEMTGSDKVTVKNTIDESIIGGFILRVGDLQYNASIANKLNRLKRAFTLN